MLIKELKGVFDPSTLAKEEFKHIKIPMTVKRTLPSGEKMVIDVKVGIKNWLDEHNGGVV